MASKMLIVAPLRPCSLVWPPEVRKWRDFNHLRIVVLHGKDKQKILDAGDFDIAVINYEGLPWLLGAKSVASFGGKRKSVSVDVRGFKAHGFDTLVMDECFVRGTPILTLDGERPIEEIRAGDLVDTHLGMRRVARVMQRKVRNLVEVKLNNGQKIRTTPGHPFYTDKGWATAESCFGAKLRSRTDMQRMRTLIPKTFEPSSEALEYSWNNAILFKELCKVGGTSEKSAPQENSDSSAEKVSTAECLYDLTCEGCTELDRYCGRRNYSEVFKVRDTVPKGVERDCLALREFGHHPTLLEFLQGSDVSPEKPSTRQKECGISGELVNEAYSLEQGDPLARRISTEILCSYAGEESSYCGGESRRKWSRADFARILDTGGFTRRLPLELPNIARQKNRGIPDELQSRFRRPGSENRCGGGRRESLRSKRTGSQERDETGGTWVDSVTHIECHGGEDVWNLEVEEAETYFAHGVLVHNCSRVKHTNTGAYKMLKQVGPTFSRRWGLTGSPASNGLHDLFGQITLIDGGRSFGHYITHYRNRYFLPHPSGFGWRIREGADKEIYERIRPVALRLDAADYISMPLLVNRKLEFDLPADVRKLYTQVEDEMYAEIDAGKVVASNAAAASSKCRQIVDGGVYLDNEPDSDDDRRKWQNLHTERVEVLAELISELQGEPILVAYEFKHSLDRLLLRFGKDTPYIGGGVSSKRAEEIVQFWNRGEIPLLLAHPRAAGHGLNLQNAGAQICWHSMTFDLELYMQFIARVHRQGQKAKRVFCHHIIAKKTIDETIYWALQAKDKTQTALLDALKQRRR